MPLSSSAPVEGSLQQGLHQDGRRLTPQRQRVLELFERRGSGCHLSAE
ncbi:MAG: transcriptional repressor, partial [Synechococcus sp.]|nr:transcriptional repressor [Synechococcus sp.]